MADALQSVQGWASDNQCSADEISKAVIVGPDANAKGLLSWAHSQAEQLGILLEVIGRAGHNDGDVDVSSLCGAIRHQLEQVMGAMQGAMDCINRDRAVFAGENKGGAA